MDMAFIITLIAILVVVAIEIVKEILEEYKKI